MEIAWGNYRTGQSIFGPPMMLSRDVLSRNTGATIIMMLNVVVIWGRYQTSRWPPFMWKTGHSLVKAKMKETGALLGGEMSGHIFFRAVARV